MKLGIIGVDVQKDIKNNDRILNTFSQILIDHPVSQIVAVTTMSPGQGRMNKIAQELATKEGLPFSEHFYEKNTAHYVRKRNTLFVRDVRLLLVDLPKQYKNLKDIQHSNSDNITNTVKTFLRKHHERYLYLVV